MIVVIDDERTFASSEEITYFRNAPEALSWVAKFWTDSQMYPEGAAPILDELWFDHDLGDEGGNIMHVVKFLVALDWVGAPVLVKQIYVHSQNPVGADNIVSVLGQTSYKVKRVPLPELEDAPVQEEAAPL